MISSEAISNEVIGSEAISNEVIGSEAMYMKRCLQLAENGLLTTRPNPMVGAVVVHNDRIVGEGYHIRPGEAHAEVNAIADVVGRYPAEADGMLRGSTLYVNLEPCSHYGKTPPCAELIMRKGIKKVVVGCLDPFGKVAGRGVQMLRDAGVDVTGGVLEDECRQLNRRFITFHTKKRPYITLKWAQSGNGFIDNNFHQELFSTPYSRMLVHKLRSENDAILVGRVTEEREHPQLNVRYWTGRSPQKIVLSTHPYSIRGERWFDDARLMLDTLYKEGIQTLLVEGGRQTLQWFIDNRLYDEVRVETSDKIIENGTRAPQI